MIFIKKHTKSLIVFLIVFIICVTNITSNYNVWAKSASNSSSQAATHKSIFKKLFPLFFGNDNDETRIYFITNDYSNDIILLESDGQYAMIDVGEDEDYPDGSDPRYPLRDEIVRGQGTEKLTIQFLKDLGVKNLEFVILTHCHDDHAGAFDEILEQFPIKKLYLKRYSDEFISGLLWDTQYVYDTAIAAAQKHNVEIIQDFNEDNTKFNFGTAKIQIFNWETDYDENGNQKVVEDENYNSLGVKVTQGNKSAFITGDIQNEDGDEDKLAPLIGHVDVFETGHHSVAGANTYNYVTTLNPTYIISTGPSNFYQPEMERIFDTIGWNKFYSIHDYKRALIAVLKNNSVYLSSM